MVAGPKQAHSGVVGAGVASNPGLPHTDFFLQGCEIESGWGRPGFEAIYVSRPILRFGWGRSSLIPRSILRHLMGLGMSQAKSPAAINVRTLGHLLC